MRFRPAFALVAHILLASSVHATNRAPIFPEPQQWSLNGTDFRLDDTVEILVPQTPSERDQHVARVFAEALVDRGRVGARISRVDEIPAKGRFIILGSRSNPLVRRVLDRWPNAPPTTGRAEGYSLVVRKNLALVAGDDDAGTFYGMQSLRQLVHADRAGVGIRGIEVRDWPGKPFRGIRLYLPGPNNVSFFKRFVQDFAAHYKYNKLVIEVNGAMRLDRHPEINAGALDFADDLNLSRRDRPTGPNGEFQDSAHHDAADGQLLDRQTVAELVQWCSRNFIEVIPEIPSLTHSYYLLNRHRELAEVREAEWPDTYCPSLPGSYDLLFDVMDEYIEVMDPRMIHIGHDEWRMPLNLCPRCSGRDPRQLFIEDLKRIHAHLTERAIRVAMWGDHLLQDLRGEGYRELTRAGRTYRIPGALSPEQVEASVPKDILIFNWHWAPSGGGEETSQDATDGRGEVNDVRFEKWGFEQVLGNFSASIRNYDRRRARRGVRGAAPSAWVSTNEFNFGKDMLANFLGCAPLLWSSRWMDDRQLTEVVQSMLPEVRRNLSGRTTPYLRGEPRARLALPEVQDESPWGGAIVVKTGTAEGRAITVPVGEDPNGLLFIHASARPAVHGKAHRVIYNPADTSALLGWYDVVFEDGFVESVPVRYGWNVLEWNWPAEPNLWPDGPSSPRFSYAADMVSTDSGRFFVLEWINTRPGRTVKEVRLRATSGATDLQGQPLTENAIILKGVEIVRKRSFPEPGTAQSSPMQP